MSERKTPWGGGGRPEPKEGPPTETRSASRPPAQLFLAVDTWGPRRFLFFLSVFAVSLVVCRFLWRATDLWILLLYSLIGVPLIPVFEVMAVSGVPFVGVATIAWAVHLCVPRLRGVWLLTLGLAMVVGAGFLVTERINTEIRGAVEVALLGVEDVQMPDLDLSRPAIVSPTGECYDLCLDLLSDDRVAAVIIFRDPGVSSRSIPVEDLTGSDGVEWRLVRTSRCEIPGQGPFSSRASEAIRLDYEAFIAAGLCPVSEIRPLHTATIFLNDYAIGDEATGRHAEPGALGAAAVTGTRLDVFVPGEGAWRTAWSGASLTVRYVRLPLRVLSFQGTQSVIDYPRRVERLGLERGAVSVAAALGVNAH